MGVLGNWQLPTKMPCAAGHLGPASMSVSKSLRLRASARALSSCGKTHAEARRHGEEEQPPSWPKAASTVGRLGPLSFQLFGLMLAIFAALFARSLEGSGKAAIRS